MPMGDSASLTVLNVRKQELILIKGENLAKQFYAGWIFERLFRNFSDTLRAAAVFLLGPLFLLRRFQSGTQLGQ